LEGAFTPPREKQLPGSDEAAILCTTATETEGALLSTQENLGNNIAVDQEVDDDQMDVDVVEN